MSHAQDYSEPVIDWAPNLDELARLQHAKAVQADELAGEIWESDEELDAFLADLRNSRDGSLS
jgi:hypothetical protein